jgi:hypothetical protein
MTNEDYKRKYPIGTKIRFTHKRLDTNKEGVIVGFNRGDDPQIYLPKADKHVKTGYYPTRSDGTKFTWTCDWRDIEPLRIKGQQLVFAFMTD